MQVEIRRPDPTVPGNKTTGLLASVPGGDGVICFCHFSIRKGTHPRHVPTSATSVPHSECRSDPGCAGGRDGVHLLVPVGSTLWGHCCGSLLKDRPPSLAGPEVRLTEGTDR